jgi:hypothetical protein
MDSCQNRSNLHRFRLSNAFGNQNLKTSPFPVSQNIFYLEIKAFACKESRTGGRGKKRSAQNLGTKGGGKPYIFFEESCAWDISLVRRDFQKARESDLLSSVAEKDSLESLKGVGLPSLTTKQFSTFSNCFNLTKLVCNACENNVL